ATALGGHGWPLPNMPASGRIIALSAALGCTRPPTAARQGERRAKPAKPPPKPRRITLERF
ncbi:hypothetical protein DWV02_25370, partial [Citrobacter freundii]